jgi:hypothetical protein
LGDLFVDRTNFGLQLNQVLLETGDLFFAGLEAALELTGLPALTGILPIPTTTGMVLADVIIAAHVGPPFVLGYYYISNI